jgi:hypothetical protein
VSRGSGLNSIVSKGPLLAAGAAYGIRLNDNNRLPFKTGDNLMIAPAESFTSEDLLYSGTRDDTTATAAVFINGLTWVSATATGPNPSDNTSPLVLGGETTTSRCAAVRFGECLIVPGTLSQGTRQVIEGYLAHKWSLAEKLPQAHLYKASPPAYVATTTLNGSASDVESDPLTTTWSMVAGPAPVTFTNPGSANTTATFPLAGTYTLRLTASDGSGSNSDEVVITVEDIVPPDPFAQWAGADESSFTQDSNADGVADGLAWMLGAATPGTNASLLLPLPRSENQAFSVTFHYLVPAERGSYSMRLQHSATLTPDSWTDVEIPDASGTIHGVEFLITPLPDGKLNQVQAVVPAGPAGKVFVRLSATVPGS